MGNPEIKQYFDATEIQFYKDAYIALAVRLIDERTANRSGLVEQQLELADKIAMKMTSIFQITRELHEEETVAP